MQIPRQLVEARKINKYSPRNLCLKVTLNSISHNRAANHRIVIEWIKQCLVFALSAISMACFSFEIFGLAH